MRNILYQTAMPLPFPMSINFGYENSRVYTVNKLEQLTGKPEQQDDQTSEGLLVIEILTSIKDFESANDASAHARPKLLVVLSLISLYCDTAFAPFMGFYGSSKLKDELPEPGMTRLMIDQVDLSGELTTMLDTLKAADEGKKRLIYSLMDRWRKARYMQEEGEDSMQYDDETLISYFHVLELLATEYYNPLKTKIKTQIAGFLNDVYGGSLLFEGEYLKSATTGKTALTETLIFDTLPVAGKVLFALSELGITGSRLKYLLNNLIKDRNSVAHGRTVYQDKIIFPVPQFFTNAKMGDYNLDTLKYLTAHAICTFAGSQRYQEEWELQDSYLIPTLDEVKAFRDAQKYKGLSNADFTSGKIDRINVGSISWYMVDKKITATQGLEIFTDFLKNVAEDSEEIGQLVLGAAIMVDAAKDDQLAQCEHVLKIASKNHWHLFGNMRDVLSFLEYNGFQPKHLEKMITARQVR